MLWRKNLREQPSVSGVPRSPSDTSADEALDALISLLKLYGQFAFDTDTRPAAEARRDCEAWAGRLSFGNAAPGERAGAEGALHRDFRGVLGFLREQRSQENDYVTRSASSLRNTILCFATCLSHTLGAEREAERAVAERMDTFSKALASRDLEIIGVEARSLTETVKHALAARREREAEQMVVLRQRLDEVKDALTVAQHKAEIDPLTQLFNRAAFDDGLKRLAALGALLEHAPRLVLVDLDHFKAINDNYGHPAGDQVLSEVSRCLNRTFLRRQDLVCRYGGEEFAVLLLDTTDEQARMLVERLLASVRALRVEYGSDELGVTLSAGSAALTLGETPASWLKRADAALYAAKSQGRDRHVAA
jgi:diguanylate cyclase